MLPFYEYQTTQFQITAGTELNFQPHLHAATEILYVKKGEILTQRGDQTHSVGAGEVMLFFPNEVHAYSTTAMDTRFLMLIYRGKLCDEIEQVFKSKIADRYHLQESELPQEVISVFSKLEKAQENHESPLIIRLYFELIWARLFPVIGLAQKPDQLSDDLLISVLSHITENFTEPISLQSLSKRFGVSRYKISRLFTHTVHTGLSDYINAMRVDKAKSLLQNPEKSVLDVAFACGFESQQTFNRVFKHICGATPKEFRREIHV